MQSNAGVRKLLELVFGKKATISEKKVAHSSIPRSLLTEDFSKKLGDVLRIRKIVYSYYFRGYIDKYILKIMSSHEDYVRSVITTCLCEYESNRKIFEKFISVCAVVMHFSEEMLSKTGVDFRDLNTDIIMVFYQNDAIQSPFLKGGDFYRFEEFIRDHKYLEWNLNKIDHASPNGATASVFLEPDQKIKEEMKRFHLPPDELQSTMEDTTDSIVQEFLSNTSPFPTLPNKAVLVERLVTSRKKDIDEQTKRKGHAKTAFINKTSHGNSSSISDSKTNCSAAQQEDIEWHESIVQAVIRHNHSNISRQENVNNQKLIEAEDTLENLKTSIKSLIEVLEKYNQE